VVTAPAVQKTFPADPFRQWLLEVWLSVKK
jgi:hypothetical protein